ncbi:MAG: hypothetical protein AMXMBFR81_17060 [Chthonomonas sp.]
MSALGHNPDILTCLANLSADEVFTPPKLAEAMLDLLPQELFQSPETTFLDPCCKTGVFLREIVRRLNEGLRDQMPDEQKRVDHILTRQVFGLATSELTGAISRRSVYCSKKADGKYSIGTRFTTHEGNIRLPRTKHRWDKSGRCQDCGASQGTYERGEGREAYAYPFIHDVDPRELFGVKFDVIVGNPPYQLGAKGGTRDIPIYNRFVEQAKKLEPRFLTMVIPSRWMASGLGLSEFRETMLNDDRIRVLVDYPDANEVFPGVEIKGGVCYWLWDCNAHGPCDLTTVRGGQAFGPVPRVLSEYDVLVRDSRAIAILGKVLAHQEPSITAILSVDKEFGWTSNFDGFHSHRRDGDVPVYYVRSMKRGVGWLARDQVQKSAHLIDTWKVMVPKAGSDGGKQIPDPVLGKSLVAPPPSTCTQSFLFFFVTSESEALSLQSYLQTRFFRFLVSLRKLTQDATRSTYTWVPQQPWDRKWTDEVLYKKYGLSESEIVHIETMIKSMDQADRR